MKKPPIKLILVHGFLALGLGVALIKSASLQLNRGAALRILAQKQHKRTLESKTLRGNILDRQGEVLATSLLVDSIYAEPRHILDKKKAVTTLSHAMPQLSRVIKKRIEDDNRGFSWIARRVSRDVAEKVRKANLKGVGFAKEERRFYPNHGLAGQLVGLVSIDGSGVSGIERSFHNELFAQSYFTRAIADARGSTLKTKLTAPLEDRRGNSVYLTIDRNLQQVAEEAVFETVSQYRAQGGLAIVIAPKTGDILAVANIPLMNPNRPESTSLAARRNNALSFTGEPGSVFKILTFASAFDANVIEPNDLFDCENGEFQIGKKVIKDISKHGIVTARDVFKYSSNVGTLKIARLVGKERLYNTIRAFGFGTAPGLGLMEEASGYVSNFQKWGDIRFANVSFGYGIMASPLQMLLAVSAIANNGVKMPPKLVFRVEDARGNEITISDPRKPQRVISEHAAKLLTDLMVNSTHEGGTGTKAYISGIEVAGKSGTAEKVDAVTKRYDPTRNRASFIGFAPANDPEVAALVVIDEPKGASYGGRVAAPAWRKIIIAALAGLSNHENGRTN